MSRQESPRAQLRRLGFQQLDRSERALAKLGPHAEVLLGDLGHTADPDLALDRIVDLAGRLDEEQDGAGAAMLLSPWTIVAVIGGLGAFFALARGMQLGEAIPVIATASVASNCSAILGGVVVFGDPIGSGVVEGLARGLAFAAVIAAAALLPAPRSGPTPA